MIGWSSSVHMAGAPTIPTGRPICGERRWRLVRRRGEDIRYRVEEVEGPERERLWKLVTDAFPLYETYQGRTDRLIPLFVLEPVAG